MCNISMKDNIAKGLKEYRPELLELKKYLINAERGYGFYPIVKLRNLGFITQGKKGWIITAKGREHLRQLERSL